MKKIVTILACFSVCLFTMAQEKTIQNEVGIVFSTINNFGLTYKTGSDTALWRFNTVFISGSTTENATDSLAYKYGNMGFGGRIGKEYRKNIVDNLELRYGADVSFTYSRSTSDRDDKTVNDDDSLNKQLIDPGLIWYSD